MTNDLAVFPQCRLLLGWGRWWQQKSLSAVYWKAIGRKGGRLRLSYRGNYINNAWLASESSTGSPFGEHLYSSHASLSHMFEAAVERNKSLSCPQGRCAEIINGSERVFIKLRLQSKHISRARKASGYKLFQLPAWVTINGLLTARSLVGNESKWKKE